MAFDEIDWVECLKISGIGAAFGALSYGLAQMLALVWPTQTTGNLLQDLVNLLINCGVDEAIANAFLNFAWVALPQTTAEMVATQSYSEEPEMPEYDQKPYQDYSVSVSVSFYRMEDRRHGIR